MICKIEYSCLQQRLYTIGRIIAVFVISPILIYKGSKNKDAFLLILGIFLILWDGIKLFFPNWYKLFK